MEMQAIFRYGASAVDFQTSVGRVCDDGGASDFDRRDCGNPDSSRPPPRVSHVHLEPAHVVRKRSTNQPLRIKVVYDSSVNKLQKEKFEVIHNRILPEALSYWQKTLLVKPVNVPIRLNRKCPNNQVLFPSHDPRQHCLMRCENVTYCGEVVVPEEHLEPCRVCDPPGRNCKSLPSPPGATGTYNADFVFYISAMQTERCHKGQTVAYAAHCQQEAVFDRIGMVLGGALVEDEKGVHGPIAGHANLCPDSISTKPQDLETQLSTVKHEILHALGFSASLYAYFRDPSGMPLTPRIGWHGKPVINKEIQDYQWSNAVIRDIERPDWQVRGGTVRKKVKMIVTPRVVEEVRRHFNCAYLEGAELEDQGEDGTALTHWEKRLFENEAMTGTHTQNPVYSRITLALMEDTGWYLPNYAMAQPLEWGRNLGCDFAMKSCKEWIDTRRANGESIHPFCEKVKRDPLETECTDNRDSLALCNLVEYNSELPPHFQNFDRIPGVSSRDVGRYGGSVNLADYCPYIQEFTWKSNNQVVRGSHCQFPDNNPQAEKNFALEWYGSGSKCFNHNEEMWEEKSCGQVRQWQHWGSGCYRYTCRAGRLHLNVANHTYTCLHTGQHLRIQLFVNDWLHIGTIVCPSCHEICKAMIIMDSSMVCDPDISMAYYVKAEQSYPRHSLKCCATGVTQSWALVAVAFFIYTLITDR
ncbi:LMLN [Cordylochernes scorpioides]|uniref:Leishmanolysin-like peptidase n=1 Tax=Cordylochernes scorpioides TaxID=51811 RepID=A0ABY6K3K0_9ARAC|nr:LMLN [Cordylochernes scorpioides]